GYWAPPAGYLTAVRELCDRRGILLACDEVQSRVGRTGKMFACEHEPVEPDILLSAKGLGSGMPIGAIIANESIMTWRPGAHGSTFGGNPVCCAAALATLDVVEQELLPRVPKLGERLLAGARRLEAKHPAIGEVRGRGLMVGVEFVKDRATREPAPEIPHDLTGCRLTPDLIYDQMIAAGCARKLVFSWAGNPGVGSLHAFRRAVEGKGAPPLEIEEYSHFGMVARFAAGAARLPFWPLRNYMGTDLPRVNPRIRHVTCPYTGEMLATVPALNPDVSIIHAQRADARGNTQIWGLLGV